MFEQIFKNIDDVLWKEAGCSSELDYTEQTSWMRFKRRRETGQSLTYTMVCLRVAGDWWPASADLYPIPAPPTMCKLLNRKGKDQVVPRRGRGGAELDKNNRV